MRLQLSIFISNGANGLHITEDALSLAGCLKYVIIMGEVFDILGTCKCNEVLYILTIKVTGRTAANQCFASRISWVKVDKRISFVV